MSCLLQSNLKHTSKEWFLWEPFFLVLDYYTVIINVSSQQYNYMDHFVPSLINKFKINQFQLSLGWNLLFYICMVDYSQKISLSMFKQSSISYFDHNWTLHRGSFTITRHLGCFGHIRFLHFHPMPSTTNCTGLKSCL